MWQKVIITLGFGRGATHATVVIDKEEFLPPLRDIVHKERKSRIGQPSKNFDSFLVGDQKHLLFGSEFVSALQSKLFKRKLINYLCYSFVALAKANLKDNQTFIIDSSTFGTSHMEININGISNHQQRQNNKGEADCAV